MTWHSIANDGLPIADHGTSFWCWAPGWDKPEALELWPDKGEDNSWRGGFGNSAGAFKEVTHWHSIEMPKPPKGN